MDGDGGEAGSFAALDVCDGVVTDDIGKLRISGDAFGIGKECLMGLLVADM